MTWFRLRYENAMSHVVPEGLLAAVRDDVSRRDPPGVLEKTILVEGDGPIGLDLGGAWILGQPRERFRLDDLEIVIPSQDVGLLAQAWRGATAESALGRTFHRFASCPWQCLVVDPDQGARLLDLLDARADAAHERAEKFYADLQISHEARDARVTVALGGLRRGQGARAPRARSLGGRRRARGSWGV